MLLRYFNARKQARIELNREQATTRRINVQPRKLARASFVQESTKTISPPPAYGEAIKTIFNTQNSVVEGKAGSVESYRTLNGRTYAVIKVALKGSIWILNLNFSSHLFQEDGGTQLVPTRAPSAALFNYQLAYNSYSK